MIIHFILVAVGGFSGSIARYAISRSMRKHIIGTWIANISGSFMLAYSTHFYLHGQLSHELWLLFGIGFAGAYTTFSTFGYESIQLLLAKKYLSLIFYISTSLIVSFGLVLFIL